MLAVNDQLIWHMSKTGKSFSPMYGVNYFFGHFKPILYLFALIYKVKPGPETLLFVQTLLLGTGAIPVYLTGKQAMRRAGWAEERRIPPDARFYSLCIALAYLFTMTLISYTSFHTIVCAIPFFLWAVYFMEKGFAKSSFLSGNLSDTVSLFSASCGFI
jgi:uncharacterized membrane protein